MTRLSESDWELLVRVHEAREKGLRPDYDDLAELVRRGVAESVDRRTIIMAEGPTLSQAERYFTLAFATVSEVIAVDDAELNRLAQIQMYANNAVRAIRQFAADRALR